MQTPDGQIYYIPAPGAPVLYKYVVNNDGNTNLINIYVTDDKLGAICGPLTLPVGQSSTCNAPADHRFPGYHQHRHCHGTAGRP